MAKSPHVLAIKRVVEVVVAESRGTVGRGSAGAAGRHAGQIDSSERG